MLEFARALALAHPDSVGVWLSGAGCSVWAFVHANASTAGELIRQALAQHGVEARPYILTADNRGAKGWSLPA
jgi:homoserine kinase